VGGTVLTTGQVIAETVVGDGVDIKARRTTTLQPGNHPASFSEFLCPTAG
jgi:hypothetical protein